MENNNTTFKKNNPRILNAWASYDWANSVYNLTITAAIFPVYYSAATQAAFNGNIVTFFGIEITSSVLYGYAVALPFLIAAILSPILSSLADYAGNKKSYMQFFTYLGSAACLALYFFEGHNVEFGIIMAIIASLGYSGAIVFYVSFLPDIATDDRLDDVSARGFSLGFLGSTIQLAISVALIIAAQGGYLGIDEGQATRLSFLFVGVWWIAFAQIAFWILPGNIYEKKPEGNVFTKGFKELAEVWQQIRKLPNAQLFLISFFFYSMGAQSLFLLATLFGEKILKVPSQFLIATILGLQLVGIIGAYFFSYLSAKKGNKFALISMLILWFIIGLFGYFIQSQTQFYSMAAVFGMIMGGYHLSRSTYAKLIPEDTEDTASFFSFYDVTEKLATAFGPFTYAFIEGLTGSMRNSMLALGIYFIVGMLFLARVKIPRGQGEN